MNKLVRSLIVFASLIFIIFPTNATNAAPAPDLIFADGFESGDFLGWTSFIRGGGDLSVSTQAALVGNYGMQATINDDFMIYVLDDTPAAETRYRARFYFDPNSITMANWNSHFILYGSNAWGTRVIRMEFRYYNGNYQIRPLTLTDTSSVWILGAWTTISDMVHFIEFDWKAAEYDGANDGHLTFWIDGVEQYTLGGIDNDTRRIDEVRLGVLKGADSGTYGTYYFDEFESRRETYIGPASQYVEFSAAPTTGAPPLEVRFTNLSQSSDPSTIYRWDFGDGSTSTEFNPIHTYVQEGLYTVSLSAISGLEQIVAVKVDYINVTGLIFADGFESGDFSAWTFSMTDGGDLSVSNQAAMSGQYGMQAVIDDAIAIGVTDDSPSAEARYRARFYFDPNSISMASGNAHFILYGINSSGKLMVLVELRFYNGSYQLRTSIMNDGGLRTAGGWATISDAAHFIEFDWKAADYDGANNGYLTFWIDGVEQYTLGGVDNDAQRMERVRLGALAGIDSGTRGVYYFDAFASSHNSYIGP